MSVRLFLLLVACSLALAQRSANPPARLALALEPRSVVLNQPIRARVELRDAYNMPARAGKAYEIVLEASLDRSQGLTRRLVIPAGQSGAGLVFALDRPGIYLVKVSHPELREDAVHVQVKGRAAFGAPRVVPALWRGRPALLAPAAFEPPQPQPEQRVLLDLRYSNEGAKLTANGMDKVRIEAFLSDPARAQVSVKFHASGGTLSPEVLRIPAGEEQGDIALTSQTVGKIRIECLGVAPAAVVRLNSGGETEVEFLEAIKEVELKAGPPTVLLGDSTEIHALFFDLKHELARLREGRKVRFLLDDGFGGFTPEELDAKPGESFVSTRFWPRKTGKMTVSAVVWGAPLRAPVPVIVTFPYWSVFAAALGGFTGSVLNFYYRQKQGLAAALLAGAVGAFAGPLYYWFIHLRIIQALPQVALSHPLMVFFITGGIALGLIEAGALIPKLAAPART